MAGIWTLQSSWQPGLVLWVRFPFLEVFFRLSRLSLFLAVLFLGGSESIGWEWLEGVVQCWRGLVSAEKVSGPLEVSFPPTH